MGHGSDGAGAPPERPPATRPDKRPAGWLGFRRRLAGRLILYLCLIVLAVQGIASLLSIRLYERRLLGQIIQGADQVSGVITQGTWQAMQADRRADAYQMMRNIARQPGIEKIRILNKEGRVMFSTGADAGALVDKTAEACDLCHAASRPLVRVDVPSRVRIFRSPSQGRVLGMVTPIYNEPACSQAECHAHPEAINVLGVLDVDMSLRAVDQAIARARGVAAGVTLLTMALAAFGIALYVRRCVGRPINKLIEATRAVGAMNLDRPVEIDSPDEIGALAESFESMRSRLKSALDALNTLTHELEVKVDERTRQLHQAHQTLVRQDRLASLGQLSASIAHEINNPLSGVHNVAMLMERLIGDRGVPAERTEEFRRYVQQVEQETDRVGNIVKDLLTFARQARSERAAVDLNATLHNTISLMSHRLRQSKAEIRLDLQGDLPPVWCDRAQFMQVVMNLVANAAESMPAGGEVHIRTCHDAGRGEAVLEVVDHGVGITEEEQARIFEPFYTTKAASRGLGLGLAVAYGIVEGHGGSIEVESEVGRGTAFRVRLPVKPAEGSAMRNDVSGSTS